MLPAGQLINPEQVNLLVTVIGTLAAANVGALISGAFQAFFSWKKMRLDINAAHAKIKVLEKKVGIESTEVQSAQE